MCLTQNPDAIPAKPFLKYPKVSIQRKFLQRIEVDRGNNI